jgi:hypothetical protein
MKSKQKAARRTDSLMGWHAFGYASRWAVQARQDMGMLAMPFRIIERGGSGVIICISVNGEAGSVNMNYK